jgi:cytochrome b561
MASAAFAWLALLLLPSTALCGWMLRRLGRGPVVARMRLHFFLGYAAFALALAHMALSLGGTRVADFGGMFLASFALLGLGMQAFVGTNLQSPGAYRGLLRRWHVWLFCIVLALATGHVLMSFDYGP